MSYEDVYQKMLKEQDDEIKKLEYKIEQLRDLFYEHTRKVNDYTIALKNVEEKMIEISKLKMPSSLHG